MSIQRPRPRFGRVFEYLVLSALLLVFARGAASEFSATQADVLDGGTDPRLLIVDLIAVRQSARSTQRPHEMRFQFDGEGAICGYSMAVQANHGEPWAVLRTRKFPARIHVSSSQPRLEFTADGSTPIDCRVAFEAPRQHWLVTVACGSGELRLIDAAAAVQ